jgi:hypothetical protein
MRSRISSEIICVLQGTGGQFVVELVDESEFGWKSAFNVVPNSGYQNAIITISVIDSAKINYETPDWREISLTVIPCQLLHFQNKK